MQLLFLCLFNAPKIIQQPKVIQLTRVGYIFRNGTERNGNGTEVAVVAYLDCIHDCVSIIFIVFIGNTLLPGFSTY